MDADLAYIFEILGHRIRMSKAARRSKDWDGTKSAAADGSRLESRTIGRHQNVNLEIALHLVIARRVRVTHIDQGAEIRPEAATGPPVRCKTHATRTGSAVKPDTVDVHARAVDQIVGVSRNHVFEGGVLLRGFREAETGQVQSYTAETRQRLPRQGCRLSTPP